MYAVKQHMSVHENESSNLSNICNICGASYGRLLALEEHMKSSHPAETNEETEEMEVYEEYIVEEETPNEDSQTVIISVES